MNSVKHFFNQQLGLSRWTSYNGALKRFTVEKNASFNSILGCDSEYYSETPIFACKFSQSEGYTNLLALANESGFLVIVDTESKNFVRSGGPAHNNAIFDIAWLPKSRKLLTASGDHTAALLDVTDVGCKIEHDFIGHSRSLKTVSCCEENAALFATGGRDGKINLWDVRASSQIHSISTPLFQIPYSHYHSYQLKNGNRIKAHQVSAGNSITGLVFQDNSLISCGASDGIIKVWDLRKTYYIACRAPTPKYILPYAGNSLNNGFTHLVIDPHRNILYASCLDNIIYAYNISTYEPEPIMRYSGHKNRSFYVKMCLGADGKYLLSGSSDNNAYIWHMGISTPFVKLLGHDEEVTGVGWNVYDNMLVTCSDDLKHKFWTISPKDLTDTEKLQDYAGHTEIMPKIECKEANNESIFFRNPECRCFAFKDQECSCLDYDEIENACDVYKPHITIALLPLEGVDRNLAPEQIYNNSMCDSNTKISSKKRSFHAADINLPSTSKFNGNYNTNSCTPTIKKRRTDLISTFLTDLPNYGVDGRAPHLNCSPTKSPEKDWLTKIKLQLRSRSNIHEISKPSTQTLSKPIPNNKNNSFSNSPLLKYFKLTNSRTNTSTKSPNISLPSTSHSFSE